MRSTPTTLLALVLAALVTEPAWAGGAWVPKPGDGTLQLGASRKKAQSSWGTHGQILENQGDHDFRYAYVSGVTYSSAGAHDLWAYDTTSYIFGFTIFGVTA